MLFASILLIAAYVPRNHFKMRLGHPMVLSVKVWALSHLLANGNLADVVLFGTFLIWSVLNFKSARARDRIQMQLTQSSEGVNEEVKPNLLASLVTLFAGMGLWALITFVLHAKVVGIAPMG